MSSTTDVNKVEVPEELLALIKKYKNVSMKIAKERFVQYLEEYSLEDDGFTAFCQRLVRKGIFKKSFLTALEDEGFIELDDEVDTSEDDTDDVDDTEEDDEVVDEEEGEIVAEDDDEVEVGDDDEDEVVVEEGDESDEVEEAEEVSEGDDSEDDVVRLVDILDLTGDYEFRAEYEDVSHAVLTAKVLEAAGFTLTLDERLGGDIERRRGGKFVMDIHVANKKACKVRVSDANPDGLGPVMAFTNRVIARFERDRDKLINMLVSGIEAQVEAIS